MPLLERVKFLAISAANLDEFLTVRVGGLEIVRRSGNPITDICGMSASEQLDQIRARVDKMNQDQASCLAEELEPQLAKKSIIRMHEKDLSEGQIEYLRNLFQEELLSAIVPVAVTGQEASFATSRARLTFCFGATGPFAAETVDHSSRSRVSLHLARGCGATVSC